MEGKMLSLANFPHLDEYEKQLVTFVDKINDRFAHSADHTDCNIVLYKFDPIANHPLPLYTALMHGDGVNLSVSHRANAFDTLFVLKGIEAALRGLLL